jgi:hypothetical protein
VEVSLVEVTGVAKVEVVHLPSPVSLHLYFLVTAGHVGEIFCKLWTPEILGIIVTVILKMLRDFGL